MKSVKIKQDESTKIDIASELKKINLDLNKSDEDPGGSGANVGIGYDDLAALYDVSQAVNSTLILDDILNMVMTRSIKLLHAERGFLMLLDNDGKLQFKTAHNIKKEQLDSQDMKISTTLANMVVKSGNAIYTSDAQTDERFSQKASILDLNIRSAMCVPLKIKRKIIGVLYLDNSSQANIFLKQDLALFEMFAAQAAVAIHNARLYTEVLELQKHQENIFINLPIGVLVVDTAGAVTAANEATVNIFRQLGWSRGGSNGDSFVGRILTDLVPADFGDKFIGAIEKATTKPIELTRLNVESANNEFVLKIRFCPFENYQGEAGGHIVLIEEITEQVVLEQYLILSEKLIAKGEMAAAIGHELNNYLAVISTNAQLLSMYLSETGLDKAFNKVNIIIKNVEHIKRFSDGLMDFSALESKPVPYDIQRLLEDLVFFVHPQQAFRRVDINLNIPGDLPQLHIDVGQIHQVFLNLFMNSADVFGEYAEGHGKISIGAEYLEAEKAIKIAVSDNGPGIPDGVLAKMFEPHITSKKAGHGFGLWTCHRIIQSHKGSITASNSESGGARFEIVLPIAPDPDE